MAEWQGIPAKERREIERDRRDTTERKCPICFSGVGGALHLWSNIQVVDSIGDQAPVCFCYLPLSLRPTPHPEARRQSQSSSQSNRYNSCRPKQCTEGGEKSSVSRLRLGQCAREAAVNCKCALDADMHVDRSNTQKHTHHDKRATHIEEHTIRLSVTQHKMINRAAARQMSSYL